MKDFHQTCREEISTELSETADVDLNMQLLSSAIGQLSKITGSIPSSSNQQAETTKPNQTLTKVPSHHKLEHEALT